MPRKADKNVPAYPSRLGFLRALANDSEIPSLDEPTSGLAPRQRPIDKKFDTREKASGKTVPLAARPALGSHLMERFIDDAPMNPKSRELLTEAIQGRGAFRRFEDTLSRAHMEETRFVYRDAAYRSRAREWYNENNIQWGEKLC